MDLAGLFLPRLRIRRAPLESRNPPHPEDLERLEELREQGSKLHLPHPVRAFVAIETEEAARQVGERLQKDGYQCTLRAAQDGSWVVTAIISMVPTKGALTRLREEAGRVASEYGGSYAGWDAPVVY